MEEEIKEDKINPSYYSDGQTSCLDAMIAAHGIHNVRMWCTLTAFKYLWRTDKKTFDSIDLQKANWYTKKAAELMDKEMEDSKKNVFNTDFTLLRNDVALINKVTYSIFCHLHILHEKKETLIYTGFCITGNNDTVMINCSCIENNKEKYKSGIEVPIQCIDSYVKRNNFINDYNKRVESAIKKQKKAARSK